MKTKILCFLGYVLVVFVILIVARESAIAFQSGASYNKGATLVGITSLGLSYLLGRFSKKN